ncbi:hypothetical protein G6F56_002373 [Rhizopus delemar]|nr:hypothetical protein G6F56_002373 [Rhizopus delemar]
MLMFFFSFLVGRVGLLANTLALLVLQKDEPCGEFIEYLYNHRETRDTTSDIGFFELLGSIHRHLIWETVLLRNAVPKTWYAKQIVLKKDGTAEEIEEADLTDPRVVNTRRFSELLSGVSPVIMLLFQSIIKLEPYINRNPSEEEGCKWFLISREISVEILKNFQWITESFENREDYIAAVSTLFSMLILEDTERRHMVSLVAVWFGAIGGIRWVVDNLTTPYSQKVANMISREDVNTTAYEQANSCLEVLYPVLQHLSIPSLYSDSVLKDIAERDKKLEMLYPENWLIFVRSGILRIKCVLDEPEFPQFPKHTIRAFLGCIKQCMYLHGERFTKLEDGFSADHGFSDLQVEDEYLQDLVTRIKNSVSPAPEETYDIVQDMSGIPEDDNDEEYEDYDDDDGDVDETGVSISFIGRAAYLLNSLRRAIRSKLPKVLISLVQDREDLDFIVRDTLIALACGDPSEAEENSKLMAQFFEGMATNGEDTLSLFENCVNRIRIFALMLREPKVQGFVSEWVSALSKLIGWVEFLEIATDNPEFSNPKWLTTLFLILESSIAQAENRPYDDSNYIDTINASVLIRCCVRLLLMDNLTEDNLLSTLRIIVRLTKRPELAKGFLLASGLPALFERPRCHFDDTVRIQQAYVIIILRHMMEDKHVMSNLMREWLMFCSRKYYSKTLPFEKKMKMAQPLFLRHPTEFIDLIQNINEGDKLVFNKKSPIEEDNHYMSRTVVHYILKELVITQANPEETNQKLGYTGYLIECLLELVSSYPSCKEDIISYKVPLDIKFHYTQDMVPESNHSILNVFLNIMVPYGLMNAVTDIERKRKCIFIWTVGLFVSLCYDTAHSGNMKPNDDQASDSGSESSWQDKPGTQGPEDEERGEILTAVRTQVMQAIAGFLEYYTKAKTRSSAKYAKYYTLAELCHYILNSRQADINPHYVVSPLVKEKNTKDLTKLMIDNNFVPLLVDAIQNVDVNYPNAKFILNSLLRPLEKLAKMASWFEQERPYDQKRERLIQERYYSVMDSERSTTPVDEIEELYRNSSMAILDGTAVEDDEEDHTDFNSEDEEIDMASSGEESINDEDHEESSEDEMMVDVEHDEDEEDDADREMNELMRNHRHHLPDTDEENSSGTEESLDEDEDDSSDSFEEEAVSDVYNSDMSDEVESEHEENWYAHNNERQRERTAGNDLFPNEEGETEDEEIVNGPQGYDITVRRRTAGGSRNMVVVNNHPNTIHMPSVAGSLGTSNKIQFLSKELPFSRDDIILHPLLRKFVDHATSDLKECITGSTSMSHLQPYKDIIGHGALVTLQSAVSSSYRPAPNDDNINPEILDAGLIVPDSDVVTESNEDDKENKNVLHMLLEFSPVPTIERWNQVTQMAFINITAAAIAKTMAARLPEVEIEQRHGEDKEDYVFEEEGDSPTAALYSFQNISENETPSTAQEDNINITFRGQEVEVQRNDIGPQFLDALPEDFRAQLLNAQDNDDDDVFVEVPFDGLDPDFLAALPDDIREDLVRQEETISLRRRLGSEEREDPAQSPENIQDNQEQTQESPSDEEEINITDFDENELPTENITAPKPTQFLDIIRIVDRSQLSILARLLFVPQSIVKVLLNRLLLNLCENTTTCDDLLSLLLCVLQDECSDLPAVDRSFSRLLNQVVATGAEKDKSSSSSVSKTSSLISQRCLEILYYVLQISWHSRLYFMVENEQFGRMENGKNRYSFLVLIDLLRRPSFLNNAQLMEQLMEILSRVCRSIPNYIEYCKNVSEENKLGDMTIMLPSKYFERVVRVLTTNECSSRTFRFTLSILSNLAHIDNGFEIIITSLKSVATQSGLLISKELEVVLSILEKLKIGKEMETSALKQFSTATSQQMKLLRVLNTMRYLYAKKNKIEENDDEEEDAKIKPEMYDGIDLQPLWKVLGSCLRIIRDKEDLVDVGNVLLPLVECFMTVSKDCISTETISDQNTLFIEFTNEHKKLLNMMVRNNPFLMNGPFSCLAHVPMILDFDNKRAYFTEVLRKAFNSAEKFPTIQLSVRREYTFEDTYEQIHELTSDEVRYGKLKVQFNDEEGVDEGGVSREWLSTLARQMFDPNYALFITSAADKLTYLPNRASGVNPDHLSYFKFVGRIIGKAIHDDRLLDAYFTRSFYKLILGRPVDYKDLEAVDPAYYKSLVWMLENDITNVIDLTFSVEVDDFGTTKIIDLKPDGENIPVTQENKHEYVNLITSQKLVLAIKPQVDAFLEGFYEIIPYQNIKIFNEQELELLISGLPDIDIDDWKANTEYQGYNFQSPQIQWFWRAVRSFDEEERAKLLQFATGTSKVPLGGFSALQGSNGLQRFQIHKEFSDTNRLPSAHTW